MDQKYNKLEGFELTKNKDFLKQLLLKKITEKKSKVSFNIKFLPVFAALLAIAAVGMYMKIDYNNSNTKCNSLGGIWCTYDDHRYGGNSKVWPPASTSCENLFVKSEPGYGGRGYAVRITGTAGTKLGSAYIGVNAFLSEHSACPRCDGIDLRRFRGIEFKIKGSVELGRVMFIIPHEGSALDKKLFTCKSLTDYEDFESDITKDIGTKWKIVRLVFTKDFKQPNWTKPEHKVSMDEVLANANLLKWQYVDGKGHFVDIWIDDLQLF
ncbi:MAG: hypothetical protein WCJ94_03105 [bacterium]